MCCWLASGSQYTPRSHGFGKNGNLNCAQYILLADEIFGFPLSELRAVYRAGGAGANNEYTPNTGTVMNSTLFARSICVALLRLRLRDIPLTRLEGGKNGNFNREGYILLADEIFGFPLSELRAVNCASCLLRQSFSDGEEPEPTTNIPQTRTK
jgi:hypothetical protein